MILPASYSNGFAPRDGSPLYPSLWRGCVGAWNPGLGPTGLTLRDWSGASANATLVGGVSAGVTRGKQSLAFNGTSGHGSVAYSSRFDNVSEASIYARVLTSTVASGYRVIFQKGNSGQLYSYHLSINNTAGKISWYHQASYITSTGLSLTANEWVNILVVRRGVTNAWVIDFYINGILDSSIASAANPSTTGTTTHIGQDAGGFWSGSIADLRVYSRALNANDAALLSLRPGIAYEMAPRRRSSSAVQFNRRRRLLLGAQS